MKYRLSNVTRKTTSTGKEMIKCNLLAEDHTETTDVAIWSSFYNFANLKDGDMVDGNLKITQNGQFTNKTLESLASTQTNGGGAYKASGGASKMMEKKQENIKEAQDNKNEAIRISQTLRDAVQLSIAEGKPTQENILKWRKWLFNNWNINSDGSNIPNFYPDNFISEQEEELETPF